MFNERMAALVGPTWCLSLFAGSLYGMTQQIPAKANRTTRLWINYKFNTIGKTGFRFANNAGAAVLLWMFTGKMIEFLLQEEFEDVEAPDWAKVAIYGGVAGSIYKCTRGYKPAMLSFVLGAMISTAYTHAYKRQMQRLA